jgi:uncharacterized membrane protein YqhA
MELYISPADSVLWVLLGLLLSLFIFGSGALFLRQMEKREDQAEKRRAVHLLNFDAL